MNYIKHNQNGMILASTMIIIFAFLIIGVAVAGASLSQLNIVNRNVFTANADLVAEAAVERSLYDLNEDADFIGYTNEVEFFNNESQGRGVYESQVVDSDDTNAKFILATAQVYRYNSSEIMSERKLKVTVVGTSSDGYSVHTGPGGLILSGSANITNSDVYVNGNITLSGAASIGTNAQPVNVNVAHISCPTGNNPGPTYPSICSSPGQQPITMAQSTRIFGSVCATNQTSTGPNNNIQPGSTGQGLIMNCVAPQVTAPTYDRAAHIARMTQTAVASNTIYNCSNWLAGQAFTRTMPANITLTGNASWASSCDLTITGDVYITGNLTIGGAARIRVAEGLTTRPVIVVDGTITTGGSVTMQANSQGTGLHFISYRSNAPCNPNCAEINGTALKNTQDLLTVDVGGAAGLPGMIMQSYWGRVRLIGSGNMGAAIGQTVDMSGAGTVTFGLALSSGETTWTISSYQRIFD